MKVKWREIGMKKKLVSIILTTALLATMLTGCGKSDTSASKESTDAATSTETTQEPASTESTEEGKVVNIYCWNDEFQGRYEAYAKDIAEQHGVTVNFVIVANENNAYQNNLDAALQGVSVC